MQKDEHGCVPIKLYLQGCGHKQYGPTVIAQGSVFNIL